MTRPSRVPSTSRRLRTPFSKKGGRRSASSPHGSLRQVADLRGRPPPPKEEGAVLEDLRVLEGTREGRASLPVRGARPSRVPSTSLFLIWGGLLVYLTKTHSFLIFVYIISLTIHFFFYGNAHT